MATVIKDYIITTDAHRLASPHLMAVHQHTKNTQRHQAHQDYKAIDAARKLIKDLKLRNVKLASRSLTLQQAVEIKNAHGTIRGIAAQYGISKQYCWEIRAGNQWRGCEEQWAKLRKHIS
jgi:beta-phosphoglucomutase-like phosphatase (HAD superfamily)